MWDHLHNFKVHEEINDVETVLRVKWAASLILIIAFSACWAQLWSWHEFAISFSFMWFQFPYFGDVLDILPRHQLLLHLLCHFLLESFLDHLEHAHLVELICEPNLLLRSWQCGRGLPALCRVANISLLFQSFSSTQSVLDFTPIDIASAPSWINRASSVRKICRLGLAVARSTLLRSRVFAPWHWNPHPWLLRRLLWWHCAIRLFTQAFCH